jgi:hypothetical protein
MGPPATAQPPRTWRPLLTGGAACDARQPGNLHAVAPSFHSVKWVNEILPHNSYRWPIY